MKFSYIMTAMAAGLMFAACSGNIEDTPQEDVQFQEPFTLTVNKDVIEADGHDSAIFAIKDANGVDVTKTQLKYCTFENINTGAKISRNNIFTAIANGEYTFKAHFKSKVSENTVKIQAQNRSKYEKYYRKVVFHEITSVHCSACPALVRALHNVADMWKKHMVVLGVHSYFNGDDPWDIGASDYLFQRFFAAQSFPSSVMNLNYALQISEHTPIAIASIVEDQIREYPATSGIKVGSELNADGDVIINASLASSTGGKYNLVYCVVADDLKFVGGNSVDNDSLYDDVVVGMSDVTYNYYIKNEISLNADQEHQSTFTFQKMLKPELKSQTRVVVYSIRQLDNDKLIIDNAVECPLGETLDYQLNK